MRRIPVRSHIDATVKPQDPLDIGRFLLQQDRGHGDHSAGSVPR